MACNNDLFDGLLFSFTEDEPNWMTENITQAQPKKQHPLLKQSASEDSVEDVFDSLDAFLASEFPELESDCIAKSPAESGSACWKADSCSPVQTAVPALSSSSTDSHTINAASAVTAAGPFACASSAPAPAESAAAAAAAAAAATAQAQAFSMPAAFTSPFAASSSGALDVVRTNSATSTGTATTTPIPRWKLYHMQQRQELLAPKAKAPKLQCVIPAASPATATTLLASNNSCGSPVSVVSGACISPSAASLSSAASISSNSSFALPQAITAEQLLILNLQQQQQQCAAAALIGGKRTFGETITVVPCAAKKRSRITAAGHTAAQHLYGLAVEPSAQLQTLQALQLQLQQQIQQNYQQQAELYQQQQLQALHQKLQLRLAVQQHQFHLPVAPTQVRHKRQTARTVAAKH